MQKTKKAIAEIEKILEKYDIAGAVFLHQPGWGEYIIKLNPSYSCLKNEPKGYRLLAKKENFEGDAEKRDKCVADTLNMLNIIAVESAAKLLPLIEMSKQFNEHFGAEHGEHVKMYDKLPPEEIDRTNYSFTGIARVTLTANKEMSASNLKATDIALEGSKNLNADKYIDANGELLPDGIKPLSIAFASGIAANIYAAHHKGFWDSAEHLRYVINLLQELFVQNGKIEISSME